MSTRGKDILLKAVIQAIPSYSMNLFQLPKCIIKEVYRLCARFWRGSTGNVRKIHWCYWPKLCETKDRGGLGFRNLEVYNQSLLASQCWRIMINKNSLAAKVLKTCYFPDCNLLDATTMSSASFLWKSLMWGKDIITTGSRWKVGDGKSIRIYKDRWIPRPSTFRPMSCSIMGENATVNQLFSPSGQWNVELLNSVFCEDDCSAILSIPLCSIQASDSL